MLGFLLYVVGEIFSNIRKMVYVTCLYSVLCGHNNSHYGLAVVMLGIINIFIKYVNNIISIVYSCL